MSERPLVHRADPGQEIMLEVWLNNFQFRDKLQLIEALRDEDMHVPFVLEVGKFVDKFERSFSADSPYPKRIGRWVGLHAPRPVIDRLIAWAKSDVPHTNSVRYRAEFRVALEAAMLIDRSSRPALQDVI
jgi:hypothetical protein